MRPKSSFPYAIAWAGFGNVEPCRSIFFWPIVWAHTYIAEDGSKQAPVMLHRAILGTLERFIGILLEHYADGLPLWLAPIQAVIMNITDRQADFAREIREILRNQGVRANLDLRNEKIGFKIREHTIARVPYQLVIGDREVADRTVAVRQLGSEAFGYS